MALLRIPLGRVALVWLVLAAILLIRAWSAISERRFPDPDDVLRLVQVRDLLAGQAWFDLHQYRIDGPHGTLMHWSRLVDLPLAVAIGLLSPVIGMPAAEQAALVAMPLLTLAAIMAVVARIASRFTDMRGVTLACLCLGLSPLLLAQVQPLRIDHHGWQIFTVALALAGLLPGRQPWRPALTGLALAAGLLISLELLPIAAAFGAVFALRWLADGATSRPLVMFLASLTVSLAGLFLATRGVADLAQHCDAIAPAHFVLFGVAALGTAIVAWARPASRLALVAALAVAAAAACAGYLWAAPQCLAGPFGNLDPLVHEFWYRNVAEGQPAWRLAPDLWLPVAAQGLVALATLAWLWRNRRGEERQWWLEYLLVTAAAVLTGLLVWRSMAFVGMLSAIPLGWLAGCLLEALRETERPGRKIGIAVVMSLVLVPSFPVALAGLAGWRSAQAMEKAGPATSPACRLAEAAPALNRLGPATIFAPLDLGPAVLDRTHHGVVATAHHRANLAMHDVLAAFLGTPGEARALMARHGAGYLMLCTEMGEVKLYQKRAPEGFAGQLVGGRVPDWLEPVPLPGLQGLRLWRVKPARPG